MNGNNPVIIGGISIASVILFVKATLNLAQSMRWLTLESQQWLDLANYAETVIPIIAVGFITWWTSRNTTNLSSPRDVDGAPLTRPDNSPAIKKMENLQDEAIKIDKKIELTRGLE
jgi:hypothetical protein